LGKEWEDNGQTKLPQKYFKKRIIFNPIIIIFSIRFLRLLSIHFHQFFAHRRLFRSSSTPCNLTATIGNRSSATIQYEGAGPPSTSFPSASWPSKNSRAVGMATNDFLPLEANIIGLAPINVRNTSYKTNWNNKLM
jgi:hypothetical protein